MVNYIFKQNRSLPYDEPSHHSFRLIATPFDALKASTLLIHHLSLPGFLKLLLKSVTKNRWFYCIHDNRSVVSRGWLSAGFCHYYPVGADDVVIGAVWTDPQKRGQGLATTSIQLAMNGMIQQGYESFYIDTQQSNAPMLRSIEKLGFGEACGEFHS